MQTLRYTSCSKVESVAIDWPTIIGWTRSNTSLCKSCLPDPSIKDTVQLKTHYKSRTMGDMKHDLVT